VKEYEEDDEDVKEEFEAVEANNGNR